MTIEKILEMRQELKDSMVEYCLELARKIMGKNLQPIDISHLNVTYTGFLAKDLSVAEMPDDILLGLSCGQLVPLNKLCPDGLETIMWYLDGLYQASLNKRYSVPFTMEAASGVKMIKMKGDIEVSAQTKPLALQAVRDYLKTTFGDDSDNFKIDLFNMHEVKEN